jgi:MFS family permease
VKRRQVLRFGVMTAVLASGYGVMFTVLDDFRDEYGIAAHWLGLIVGIGFLAGFFAQIFLAPIADRGYARRMVLIGLSLNVVGLLTMAVGDALPLLLAGRLVSGLGMGMAIPSIRRIVINADPANIGYNVGLLLSADVTGFAFGPVVSALLVPSLGLSAPFFAIAGATAVCIPFVLRLPIVEAVRSDAPRQHLAFDLLGHRPIVAGLMMGSAVFLMIGTFDALWAIVLDDLEASELVANIGITIFALPLIFLGATGGKLAQRVGPFRLGPLGLLFGALFMFLYGFMPTGWAMLMVGTTHAVFDGLTVASAGVAVGMAAPKERQASAQGLLGATESLTGGVTAVLAGVLYSAGGRVVAYTTCAILMVALAVGAYLLVDDDYRRRRVVEPEDALSSGAVDPASAVTGHA